MTTITVSAGVTSSGNIVTSGNSLNVSSGGIAVSSVVSNGGTVFVFTSGVASGTTVSSGGAEYVFSGSTASGIQVKSGGTLVELPGANVTNITSAAGALVILSGVTLEYVSSSVAISAAYEGQTVIGAVVTSSARLVVNSGVTSSTVLNGGEEVIYAGTASGTVMSNFGDEVVSSGGTEIGAQVGNNGYQYVYGGVTSSSVLSSGGFEYLSFGGLASGTLLQGGGIVILSGGTARATVVSSGGSVAIDGGTASGTQVSSGGDQFAANSGTASNTVVSSGGKELVALGATSYVTRVINGGIQAVYDGGVTSGTVVSSGANEQVLSRGTAIATVVSSGGYEIVSAGGAVSGTRLMLGGAIDDQSFIFAAGGSATLNSTTDLLTLTEGVNNYAVSLQGSYAGERFALTSDSVGGTNITVVAACFCAGTRIATPAGDVAVEALSIGDEVTTLMTGAQRIKWIGHRAYAAAFAGGDFVRPIILRAGALDDGVPAADLRVSPGHALYVDGHLIHAWRLVNDVTITHAPAANVEYFHIELETQDILYANGAPAESFHGAQFRGQFQNVAAFAQLYPAHVDGPRCLPLLEQGFALRAILARLAARAGIATPAPMTGKLRGFVDIAGPQTVEGWAQDCAAMEVSVVLEILADGVLVGRVLANAYRADLRGAGIGSGCHAFRFTLPPGTQGQITVRRAADGSILERAHTAVHAA